MSERGPTHYIDNEKFYEALVERRRIVEDCRARGVEPPPASRYIGECLMLICQRLGTKRNFSGYSYRDEMVSDAIENCALVIDSFDPSKSNNPFGYFSLVAQRAFFRRLQKEKKQQYARYKAVEMAEVSGTLAEVPDDSRSVLSEFLNNEANINFVRNFEEKQDRDRKRRGSSNTGGATVMEFVG